MAKLYAPLSMAVLAACGSGADVEATAEPTAQTSTQADQTAQYSVAEAALLNTSAAEIAVELTQKPEADATDSLNNSSISQKSTPQEVT